MNPARTFWGKRRGNSASEGEGAERKGTKARVDNGGGAKEGARTALEEAEGD